MNIWDLLDESKWAIINQLTHGKKTMREVAENINSSVANIGNHLKLMEAYGFVDKEKDKKNKGPGKPSHIYELKQDFSMIAYAAHNTAERKVMEDLDRYHKMILSILMLENPEDHYFLHKLLWQNEELIQNCKAINFLESDREKIQLFIVTDHLEEIRENFSNVVLENPGGEEKKVVCWSHNEDEIERGLEEDDEYYEDLVDEFKIIYDPENIMRRWSS